MPNINIFNMKLSYESHFQLQTERGESQIYIEVNYVQLCMLYKYIIKSYYMWIILL